MLLPPEIELAYRRVIAPPITVSWEPDAQTRDVFADGFMAGRQFQYDQLRRVLCKDCLLNKPFVKDYPIPTHVIDGDGNRRTCQAREIAPFDPR